MHAPSWFTPKADGPWLRPAGQCAICRSWDARPICSDCVARFAPALPRCARCGLRTGTATAACGACLADPPPFEACIVAVDYAFPWDRLISDFKFNQHVELADALARLLLAAGRERGAAPPDILVPVPLAPRRLAARGYNQAWELARRVARGLGCPAHTGLIVRPAEGAHQASLTLPQRLQNLRGAFVAMPARRTSLQGRRVGLVDDVMTSGATLREAAAALRRAGAAQVEAWVLARTPAPAD